ncbi:MAG: 50S ribosomal protein L25 [Candidatus Saccharimonadales bacterium]
MSQEKVTLELEKREVVRKGLRRLRDTDKVPAVIHDHGKPSTNVQADYNTLHKVVLRAGKHHPVNLTVGSAKFTALIKDVAYEPRKHRVSHVVFNAVNANETVDAEIPVRIKFNEGNDSTPAERASLVVLHNLDVVEVEALPADLPDFLEFDGEKLVEAGDQATVADLIVPKNVKVTTEPEHVLATVFEPSALAAANEAAGGDAEVEDPASEVDADHGDAADDVPGQDAESRPGGKEQKEPKQLNVDANK